MSVRVRPAHLTCVALGRRARARWLIRLFVALVASVSFDLGLVVTSGASSVVGYWQDGGSLITPAIDATSTLLANGLILVAGGEDFTSGVANALTTAELFNPATGVWTSTGSLNTPRINATAVLLQNGSVLVAGGENLVAGVPTPLLTSELYNPSTGLWTATGSLASAVFNSSLSLLPSGKALLAGGENILLGVTSSVTTSETFNPATGTWTATSGALLTPESSGSATVLANGKVILIGGENVVSGVPTALATLQFFDPTVGLQGTWSTLSAVLPTAEFGGASSLLANGTVLYAGGETVSSGVITALNTSYIFDPSANTVTATTGTLGTARYNFGAAVLSNGVVLVAGGTGLANGVLAPLTSTETFDPSTGLWTTSGSLLDAQSSPTLLKLSSGDVFAVGGTSSSSGPVSEPETFLFGQAPAITSAASASFSAGSAGSFSVTTTGTPTASLSESGALPSGVTFTDQGNGTAVLAGTAALSSASSYSLTLSATNATGLSTSQTFALSISVPAAPSTTSAPSTTAASSTTSSSLSSGASPAGASLPIAGYWIGRENGSIYGHGSVSVLQSSSRARAVAVVATSDGKGYWIVTRDGRVFNVGDAGFFGSPVHVRHLAPIVAMAASPDGKGYWLLTDHGNVYSYGDAKSLGSIASQRRLLPAVGIAAATDGKGYWIASRNGIVSGFGSVPSYGASPNRRSIVGISATPDGKGYWLLTAQGNVYNLGSAPFYGSLASRHHLQRIVAMVANPGGAGYYLVGATGDVYPFGGVPSFGSTNVKIQSPIIGIALSTGA